MKNTEQPEWEKKLNAALEDMKAGRVQRFLSEEEFMKHLKGGDKPQKRTKKPDQ